VEAGGVEPSRSSGDVVEADRAEAGAVAEVVLAQVHGDADEPAAEGDRAAAAGRVPEGAAGRLEGAEEGALGEVAGVVRIARVPAHQREDQPLVPLHQRAERLVVADQEGGQERLLLAARGAGAAWDHAELRALGVAFVGHPPSCHEGQHPRPTDPLPGPGLKHIPCGRFPCPFQTTDPG